MRTQFLYVGLLSMTLAGGLISAGCSDIHTGQPSDPGGSVRLVRVVVQDDDVAGENGIGSAIDLLDRVGTPLSTAHECDPDRLPCRPEFVIAGGDATFDCVDDSGSKGWTPSLTGFRCTDPMNPQRADGSARAIPLQPPTGGPGTVSGTEIRVVFNKVLNNSELEDIAVDDSKQPGEQLTYTTKAGIVEVLGPDNKPIPTTVVWNSAGSATATSDVIGNPFGPALVVEIGQLVDAMGNPDPVMGSPNYALEEGVKYTLVLHSDKIHDRAGNGLADQDGNPISGDVKIDFTAHELEPLGGKTAPDITGGKDADGNFPAIATDDVISMVFINGTDALPTVTITDDKDVPVTFKFLTWNAVAWDKKAMVCKADPSTVNVTPVNDTGHAIPWPAGTYKITVSAKKTTSFNSVSSFNPTWTFTVDPMAKTGSTTTSQKALPTPADCGPPAM